MQMRNAKPPQGRINVAMSVTYVQTRDAKWPHSFVLHTPTTHHLFAAGDSETALSWVSALRLNSAFLGACSPEVRELVCDGAADLCVALESARRRLAAPLACNRVESSLVRPLKWSASPSQLCVTDEPTWQYLDDWDRLQGPFSEFLMSQWLQVTSAAVQGLVVILPLGRVLLGSYARARLSWK